MELDEDTAGLPDDGFDGPAVLLVGGADLAVTVHLRGLFQPIDGRYHWYGRIEHCARLSEMLEGGRGEGVLRTDHGEADCALSDPDPWGRYRVDGVSAPPPFPVRTTL